MEAFCCDKCSQKPQACSISILPNVLVESQQTELPAPSILEVSILICTRLLDTFKYWVPAPALSTALRTGLSAATSGWKLYKPALFHFYILYNIYFIRLWLFMRLVYRVSHTLIYLGGALPQYWHLPPQRDFLVLELRISLSAVFSGHGQSSRAQPSTVEVKVNCSLIHIVFIVYCLSNILEIKKKGCVPMEIAHPTVQCWV